MSVLESVLNYKRQREAEAAADLQAIPSAINQFVTARQQAQKSALETMLAQSTIAKNNADILQSQNQSSLLNIFMSGANGGAGNGIVVPEATIGGFKLVNPAVSQKLQESELNQKNLAEARKTLDEYSSTASEALTALDKIEEKALALPSYERGFGKQLLARGDAFSKKFSKDKSVVEFTGSLSQELAPLARKLAEEKGPLTNKDIDRIVEGLGGDLTTPTEDKVTLLNELREKIRAAAKNKAQVAGLSDEEFGKKYKDLNEKLSKGSESPVVAAAMKKFPGKSKEEIVAALKKKGLLK